MFRNRSQPTKTSVSSKPPASRICIAFMDKNGCVNQSSSREATIRSPTMSPSHQCSQIVENSSHSAKPPRLKLVTPMVAATAVLRIPANRMNLRQALCLFEGVRAVSEPGNQRRSQERFKRIAGRDAQRCGQRSWGIDVYQEGAEKYSRPEPISPQ